MNYLLVLGRKAGHFVMSIESTGCVSAKDLLPEVWALNLKLFFRISFLQALHIIKDKAIRFDKLLTEGLEKLAKKKEKEEAERIEKEKAAAELAKAAKEKKALKAMASKVKS